MSRSFPAWSVLLPVFIAASAAGELIVLEGGQTIKAAVIREYPDRVVVDLGYDVLSIARNHIRSIEKDEAAGGEQIKQAAAATEHLYSTADMPVQPIESLVAKFGVPAVVMHSVKLVRDGVVTLGQPLVVMSINATSKDKQGRAVAYVGRIVLKRG